jgi:hypothetical protein
MPSVFNKLNLKEQKEIVIINAPESFEPELARLKGIKIRRNAQDVNELLFSLTFVTKQNEVDTLARTVARKAQGDALVWFAYPKGSSKKYHCDFNRDTGWAALGKEGFEVVRLVAIDEDWSAMRFRRAEFISSMTRDKKRAMSRQGRKKVARKK